MAAISVQQIYDLLLEISRDVAELDASVDELLFDMKALNQELSAGRQLPVQQARPT
jgi:outer membrane murein-binding lipoprotein Lpp